MDKEEINQRIQTLETELARLKEELNKSNNVSFKYITRERCFVGSSWVSTGFTVTLWEENAKFTPVPFTGELPK